MILTSGGRMSAEQFPVVAEPTPMPTPQNEFDAEPSAAKTEC